MYLFKFLAHSFVLTPMVMLRMLPVLVITFFLVGVVVYVLAPYPIGLGLVMALITWPIMILLAISFVRAGLNQLRATSAPDLPKLFRKTVQLSLFHFVIALFFSILTWVVTASLVPENWREMTAENLGAVTSSRSQVSFPTIDNRRSNRNTNRPGVFSNRGLDDINPGGVERASRPPRQSESAGDGGQAELNRSTPGGTPESETESAEPEIQEEITSVVIEGEAAAVPSLKNFFTYVLNFYRPLMIGYFGVQGLYWIVLSALTVPFASQAATIASNGPKHEFLWGTGKKAVPIFILMVLSNSANFIGFIALTFYFGTSLTLAAQELETGSTGLQDFLRSGGYYIGSILLLSLFTYSWIASGAAVAYVDARVDMQRKKDIELGRILASAEKGPDIRALIRARKEQGALAEIPDPADAEAVEAPDAEAEAAQGPSRPTSIRPATAEEVSGDGFTPMVSALAPSDENKDAPPPDEPLKLSFDDEEPPEDYDEDWFLKPLPGESGYTPPEPEAQSETGDVTQSTEALAARIQAATASPAPDSEPESELEPGEFLDTFADSVSDAEKQEPADTTGKDEDEDEVEDEDEDLEWVRKLFREGDTADERKG